MRITITVKTERYRFLWLKYVVGFDPSQHCAKCLRGSYAPLLPYRTDRKVPAGTYTAELDTESAPYLYLCGVTPRYAENLHIAFRHKPGSVIEIQDGNIAVRIEDAERLPIDPLPQSVIQAHNLTRPFWSCRNFQWGWQTFCKETEARA